jgi:glutathione synthase/RimK-type ligase-like ATP-grasp enzyme
MPYEIIWQNQGTKDIEKVLKGEPVLKIVDHAQGRGVNRFKNGAYTSVFEYFKSVCNKALGC